MSEICEFILQP